ncbi:MAG: hypothetical protein ACRCXZ_00520, partial [Patescibacteria group bacterium]
MQFDNFSAWSNGFYDFVFPLLNAGEPIEEKYSQVYLSHLNIAIEYNRPTHLFGLNTPIGRLVVFQQAIEMVGSLTPIIIKAFNANEQSEFQKNPTNLAYYLQAGFENYTPYHIMLQIWRNKNIEFKPCFVTSMMDEVAKLNDSDKSM